MRILTTIIILLFCFCINFSFAQKTKRKHIPAEAITKFSSMYPKAKDVDWIKSGRIIAVEFMDDKIPSSVLFDLNSKVLQIIQYIDPKELPEEAAKYLDKYYTGKKIKEISKIKDTKNDISFIVEIKNVAVVFDASGKFQRINK